MRRIALAVPAAAAVLALSACGGSETAAPAAEPTATTAATTPPPEEIAAVRAQEGPTYVNPADVQLVDCADHEDGPRATVRVTNHDVIARGYYVWTYFTNAEGVRFHEDAAWVDDVAPGETAEEVVQAAYESMPGITCRLGEALTAPMTYSVPPGFWKLQVGG